MWLYKYQSNFFFSKEDCFYTKLHKYQSCFATSWDMWCANKLVQRNYAIKMNGSNRTRLKWTMYPFPLPLEMRCAQSNCFKWHDSVKDTVLTEHFSNERSSFISISLFLFSCVVRDMVPQKDVVRTGHNSLMFISHRCAVQMTWHNSSAPNWTCGTLYIIPGMIFIIVTLKI